MDRAESYNIKERAGGKEGEKGTRGGRMRQRVIRKQRGYFCVSGMNKARKSKRETPRER